MGSAVGVDRLHFAFTITFHYIFPQLTMGLALLLLILKTAALRTGNESYNRAVRFWARIFAINFALGVVTGIPMEFQFGTNWAAFSRSAGGVIGQTLAMEGVFSFFLESTFLGLMLFGEKRLGQIGHWFSVVLVWLGSWLSGYLIIATDAWMQHPLAYSQGPGGNFALASFWGFAAQSLGALAIRSQHAWRGANRLLRDGGTGRILFALQKIRERCAPFPPHRSHRRSYRCDIAVISHRRHARRASSPVISRLRSPRWRASSSARKARRSRSSANPTSRIAAWIIRLIIPKALSFLTYRAWTAEVRGLDSFPESDWPDFIPLVYYSYHVMVGLGTIFIAIMLARRFSFSRAPPCTARPGCSGS